MSEGATWWWVRHGPTHAKTFVGWRDIPADLSDTAQLTRLSAYLPADALIVASPLIRASETADAIQDARTRLPDVPALREFSFGDWDGRSFDDVARTDPDLSRAYWEDPGHIRPPNGESWHDAAGRVAPIVDQMNQDHAGRDIIVVAHIGIIMTQIARATNLSPSQIIGHRIDNLSVTRITYGSGSVADPINHLP
ncbi:MAG: histidine phosphatase family protein [Rhodobacteraceae bacterium]|nr:histidine phosphatase family protein [Paracoccaceae bacterium]